VKRWRCGLSAADRARLGVGKNWRCGDVAIFIDRLGFDQLGPARAGILDSIPPRFVLPAHQIDLLIQGGADTLRESRAYQTFRSGL
jgi:NTE family protein